ncbi:cupin domain-containing protein [Bdellovibrio sp. 22V]|uniref:cupin domain-containing protein n=1 Tax=Bdellovibrio sp. 22V TaxID=3044166 RepID=UPI0025433DDA|nr:cupin domain-containing protein [Bdellovibrio sp. 22V]WII73326.1 cupin domain-containing protein [Bdellovibrio sp. 22V]
MATNVSGQTPSPQKQQPQGFQESLDKISSQNFSEATEVREFPNGKLELLKFGDRVIGRATLQPGWKWSESVKSIAGTESCEAPHFQYHVSGVLKIKMDDGTEIECKAGDISNVPPGHDAWVVGDEPVVIVDFQGMATYAQEPHKH